VVKVSKGKELIKKYENDEITLEKLYNSQDEMMAENLIVVGGVSFLIVLIIIAVTILKW
jgi:hypothetical protein